MNLHQAKMLILGLATVGILLLTLASWLKWWWLMVGAAASYLLLMLVWLLFNRCPHCGKHLGQNTSIYCPHCRKKL